MRWVRRRGAQDEQPSLCVRCVLGICLATVYIERRQRSRVDSLRSCGVVMHGWPGIHRGRSEKLFSCAFRCARVKLFRDGTFSANIAGRQSTSQSNLELPNGECPRQRASIEIQFDPNQTDSRWEWFASKQVRQRAQMDSNHGVVFFCSFAEETFFFALVAP